MKACKPAKKWPFAHLMLMLFIFLSCSQGYKMGESFKKQPISINDYGLFDLGVADADRDGRLDIFTANHSAQQSLMLNKGPNGFTDVYSRWKLDQDNRFPGLAIFPDEPKAEKPGIYINWVGPDVFVRLHGIEKGATVPGRIEVYTSVKIMNKQNFTVQVIEKQISPAVAHSTITFTGQSQGYFSFRPFNHALPFEFHLDAKIAAKDIHVGRNFVTPESRDFAFQLRDRHGMAWADFNNDDRMDVFITRGGERDKMSELPMPFWDELLIGTPTCLEDIGTSAGLAKNGCPGREAAWVDFDQDNLLDIYVVCGRGAGSHVNMLFRQTSDGHFEDVAAKTGLDIPSKGSFVWLDVDEDNDMDLFWSDADGFTLYRNENGKFSPEPVQAHNRKGVSHKLSMADFDNDGDLDIFSATPQGNVLFINAKGDLSAILPTSIGLPEKSATANWVDYDNNGMLDLHTVPQGLYVQKSKGRFMNSGILAVPQGKLSPYAFVDARAAWFDVDNNGTRDLLLATEWGLKGGRLSKWMAKAFNSQKRFGGLNTFWKVDCFNNRNSENHWLQIQLTGPPGNRQAIGARVILQTADGQQYQQVGIAEGSHYCQGHYRLYYGLGRQGQPLSLRILWPDGQTKEIAHPPVDRLLHIDWRQG